MPVENVFTRIVDRCAALPEAERPAGLTQGVGEAIPFVATAGLRVEVMTPTEVAVVLPDEARAHNHIGGLHAAAMVLAAETATGLVFALNVPGASVPLLRSLGAEFRRRAEGRLRAVATLTPEETERIRTRAIGKCDVPVTLADESGEEPVACTMRWAWMPRSRALR